jgi:WXG100 family type VII secretion target
MPSSTTQVNYDELQRIAKSLRQESDDIAHIQFTTRCKLETLKNEWAGGASAAFFAEMEGELLPGVGRLSQALLTAESTLMQIMSIFHEADLETVGYYKNLDGSTPQPTTPKARTRIYLINGINYNPKDGDNGPYDLLAKLKEKYGNDVDVVVVGNHPYDTNLGQYATNFSGTQFGGWLSPIDWLTGKAAKDINDLSGGILGAANTVVGVGQVINEYITGGSGESQKVYEWIKNDMQRNGLIGDQNLNVVLVGHSGGGAIGGNIVDDIEDKLHVNVSSLVTLGSPISNYDLASQHAEKIIDIGNSSDLFGKPLGQGTIRSDEMRLSPLFLPFTRSLPLPSVITSIFGADSYFRNPNINVQQVTTNDGNLSPWNPANWFTAHGSYWNSSAVTDAIGTVM